MQFNILKLVKMIREAKKVEIAFIKPFPIRIVLNNELSLQCIVQFTDYTTTKAYALLVAREFRKKIVKGSLFSFFNDSVTSSYIQLLTEIFCLFKIY